MKNYRLTCHTGEEVPDSLRSDEKPYVFARTGVLYLFCTELFKRCGAAGGEGWIMLHKGENLWEDVVWGEG